MCFSGFHETETLRDGGNGLSQRRQRNREENKQGIKGTGRKTQEGAVCSSADHRKGIEGALYQKKAAWAKKTQMISKKLSLVEDPGFTTPQASEVEENCAAHAFFTCSSM